MGQENKIKRGPVARTVRQQPGGQAGRGSARLHGRQPGVASCRGPHRPAASSRTLAQGTTSPPPPAPVYTTNACRRACVARPVAGGGGISGLRSGTSPIRGGAHDRAPLSAAQQQTARAAWRPAFRGGGKAQPMWRHMAATTPGASAKPPQPKGEHRGGSTGTALAGQRERWGWRKRNAMI